MSYVDHIHGRMEASDLVSAISIFNPIKLKKSSQVMVSGEEGVSIPDIDSEETKSEWKLFRRVI